jgi:hypothetical protein
MPNTVTFGPVTTGARLAAALALVAAVAGCSSQPGGPGDGVRSPRPTTSAATAPTPTFALTGRPAPDADTAVRPAISVRIDDVDAVRARAGIAEADIVFEDLLDAKRTGMLAVFQSGDAATVGPVGATEVADALLLVPLHGLYAHVGGPAEIIRLIRAGGIADLSRSRAEEAYKKREGRPPPRDQFTSTGALRERTPVDARPPDPVFLFRAPGAPVDAPGAAPLGRMIVRPGTIITPSFGWDPGNKRWQLGDGDRPRVAEGNEKMFVENVIVQLVPYENGRPNLVGEGDILVATGGSLVRGRWIRDRPAVATRWIHGGGDDVRLDPGRTWVLIVPVGTPVDTTAEPAPPLTTPPTTAPPTTTPPATTTTTTAAPG